MANDKKFVVKNGLRAQNIDFKNDDGSESVLAEMLNDGNLVLSTTSGTSFSLNDTSFTHSTLTIFEDETQGLLGQNVELGINDQGSYTSNPAIVLTQETDITDATALINEVLGKLVPDPPPAFPNSVSLVISNTEEYRMCDFTQTDNTLVNDKNVSAGTTVSTVLRTSTYTTDSIISVGPGKIGTITVYVNGVSTGTRDLTSTQDSDTLLGDDDGVYGDLIIANNKDWALTSSEVYVADEFWQSLDIQASGTVTEGWNEVYIDHSEASFTNAAVWYYDASTVGAPQLTNVQITPTTVDTIFSSTVPHYTSSTVFTITFDVSNLSGDTYPVSDTFITGASRGAFTAPSSVTYLDASITTPLPRNLYVASGNASITTTTNIISGFGVSNLGPTVSVDNSYQVTNQNINPSTTVLYKTGTANQIEETAIPVNSVGVGSGDGTRIENLGSTDTPSVTSTTVFNSQTSTLLSTDATVVASVLQHDETDYSTYLPVGPDLSTGRSGSQYFTFKFVRTAVSKFDIKYTGTIAGLWVSLPGSQIDTTSTLNGWIDASQPYDGAGIPGAGTGGNGSNGCAIGGTVALNSSQTDSTTTITFGTVSSTNTATNEILVRIKLTSGQTVTALSIEGATN